MPGALTPTEVITAWKAGADMVKIFPASAVGGAKYLQGAEGPAARREDAADRRRERRRPRASSSPRARPRWASARELVDIAALTRGDDAVITERARELVAAVAAARAKK